MDRKLLKQHKSTFRFGISVRYEKILTRGYGEDGKLGKNGWVTSKVWKQKPAPIRTGIVVGWRWLSNGIGNYDSEDGNCYTATESLFAIEVKRGMMNKVDLVLPESLTLITSVYNYKASATSQVFGSSVMLPDRISTMSDKDKQWLSNEMKSAPRDSKGKWK